MTQPSSFGDPLFSDVDANYIGELRVQLCKKNESIMAGKAVVANAGIYVKNIVSHINQHGTIDKEFTLFAKDGKAAGGSVHLRIDFVSDKDAPKKAISRQGTVKSHTFTEDEAATKLQVRLTPFSLTFAARSPFVSSLCFPHSRQQHPQCNCYWSYFSPLLCDMLWHLDHARTKTISLRRIRAYASGRERFPTKEPDPDASSAHHDMMTLVAGVFPWVRLTQEHEGVGKDEEQGARWHRRCGASGHCGCHRGAVYEKEGARARSQGQGQEMRSLTRGWGTYKRNFTCIPKVYYVVKQKFVREGARIVGGVYIEAVELSGSIRNGQSCPFPMPRALVSMVSILVA